VASLPNLRSGSPFKHPLTRVHKYRVGVAVALDTTEQRWSKDSHLEEFDLNWPSISTHDKNTLQDFYNARQGSVDTTWDATLEDPIGSPTTFTHLQFVPGTPFTARNFQFDRWQVQLKVRQMRKQS